MSGFTPLHAFLCCLALTTASSIGAPPSATPSPTPQWHLPALEYFIEKLPAPPREGSFRDRLDLQDARARQASMSPEQLAHARVTFRLTVFTFSEAMGDGFNPTNYPQTAAFFARVANDANLIITGLKNHYKRVRPFQAHPGKVSIYVPAEAGYSYPSGHSTRSRLYAMLLAELDPSKKREISLCAQKVATDRILAGEHYLTDLEAGRKLGKLIFQSLMRDPSFHASLEAVRQAEWTNSPQK
ncbi:acid phosphatase [Terrimicrobium sacchariphilum]|uniref:Acid phosphatase n=1 Tax=Terrimicrobium sacchariphilum TaxID=690879 RepID=A0A146G728_TERSA|nr:phosphatase PAP2 family protein [Terrimicrobium sacchariphilum]GAT33182.1 acid phosphatase [Terrimicrobium sacchariphilum]